MVVAGAEVVVVVGGRGGQGMQAWPRQMKVAMESVRASFIVCRLVTIYCMFSNYPLCIYSACLQSL